MKVYKDGGNGGRKSPRKRGDTERTGTAGGWWEAPAAFPTSLSRHSGHKDLTYGHVLVGWAVLACEQLTQVKAWKVQAVILLSRVLDWRKLLYVAIVIQTQAPRRSQGSLPPFMGVGSVVDSSWFVTRCSTNLSLHQHHRFMTSLIAKTTEACTQLTCWVVCMFYSLDYYIEL